MSDEFEYQIHSDVVVDFDGWSMPGLHQVEWERLRGSLYQLFDAKPSPEMSETIQSGTIGADGDQITHSIRNDRIVWLRRLNEPPSLALSGPVAEILCALESAAERLYQQIYRQPAGPREVQLSFFKPHGFYVRHLDVNPFRKAPLSRKLTVILYLNRDWKPEDQGCLRVFHSPEPSAEFTDVSPKLGTLLAFDATKIEHQVMPTTADRFALTVWMYQ